MLRERAVKEYQTGVPGWEKLIKEVLVARFGVECSRCQVQRDAKAVQVDDIVFTYQEDAVAGLGVILLRGDGSSRDLGVVRDLWELGEALSE